MIKRSFLIRGYMTFANIYVPTYIYKANINRHKETNREQNNNSRGLIEVPSLTTMDRSLDKESRRKHCPKGHIRLDRLN